MTATATPHTPPAGSPQREHVEGGDTVLHALDRAVAAHPDGPFLDFDGRRFTYRETRDRAMALARGLRELGVDPGDRVATQLDNCEELVFSWFAANLLGAVWVPINTAYRGEFLRHQMLDCGARVLVVEERMLDDACAIDLPGVEHILVRGTVGNPDPRARALAELAVGGPELTHHTRPSDIACILYTSGTTGPSKGCMISSNYLCNMGYHSNMAVPPLPFEVNWTCNPLFHMSALGGLTATLLNMGLMVIAERFSVTRFWGDIERSGATTALMLGPTFRWLLDAPETPEQLRCVGRLRAATGYVDAETAALWRERFGVEHMNRFAYGQTEGVWLTITPAEDVDLPAGCVGRICEDFEIRALDDHGSVLPDGEPGEICFRPRRQNIMFSGYWNRPEETAAAWVDLWMHSGDVGYVRDGYLFFVDRKKDYLRNRGENISSFELERAYLAHPAVGEAAVFAVDQGRGEGGIKIAVVAREGSGLTPEALCEWSIEHLPHFAVPRYFEIRTEFPRTPTGKIQKFALRDEALSAATWDREAAGVTVRRR